VSFVSEDGPARHLRASTFSLTSSKIMATNTPSILNRFFQNPAIMDLWQHTSPEIHILFVLAVAFLLHRLVKIIQYISEWSITRSHAKANPFGFVTQQSKFITITRLIVSGISLIIYFFAVCAKRLID
jgi:hypothetical protein